METKSTGPHERYDRLLRAAEEEFTERGYAAATVARIAARAGVTVQTLYLAWGSKRALLRAYMYEFMELLAPHLSKRLVRDTEKLETQEEVNRVMADIDIPVRDTP